MKLNDFANFKFTRFKQFGKFELGDHFGFTLEKLGGGICCYATDETHKIMYALAPLGYERDFKDATFYFYRVTDTLAFVRVRRALLMVDFANKFCATNVENFRIHGCPDWGLNCTKPWQDEYTKLYNEAEKKRIAEDKEDFGD